MSGTRTIALSIHTNTVEGYFSRVQARHARHLPALLEKHLHRYLAEFDFRYKNRVSARREEEQRAAKSW